MKTILWTIYGFITGILWLIFYVLQSLCLQLADIFGAMKEFFDKQGEM